EANPVCERQQNLADKGLVGEALWRDQHCVDSIAEEVARELVPFVTIGRVDGGRPYPEAPGSGDLVSHEREQRRDDDRRTGTAVAQDTRGDEINDTLAPAGPLDHQKATPVVHQSVDRFPLTGTKL